MARLTAVLLVSTLLSTLGCGPKRVGLEAASEGVHDRQLARLLEEHWDAQMSDSPVWASSLGDHRFSDQLGDSSPERRARLAAEREQWLRRALAISPEHPSDLDTLGLFVADLENQQRRVVCRMDEWALSARDNPLNFLHYVTEVGLVHARSVGTRADLIARYRAFPRYIEDRIGALRAGLEDGYVANRTSLALVVTMLEREVESESAPDSLAGEPELAESWRDVVRPALGRFLTFVRDELLPKGRGDDAPGLTGLPNGDACYRALVRQYTTLETSAEDLHRIGMRELEGIHAEFRQVGDAALGISAVGELFERLRSDRSLYFDSAEAVEEAARTALERAQDVVPSVFEQLPKTRCDVRPIPAFEAPYTTIAYYRQPDPTGARPGTYYVNTYAPETRPRFEAEVLAFHEAVPGHHLQIARSQELPAMPLFRRHLQLTVFVEGWALYTERLSDELGLYSSELDRLGMLSFDAWRASRLVVDTGLHHLGWSREEAERFLENNTPLSRDNIRNEVDRYINTPGQALAYKTGQLALLALRKDAEEALGDQFDLGQFHEVVLGAGTLPLPMLEAKVEQWLRSAR